MRTVKSLEDVEWNNSFNDIKRLGTRIKEIGEQESIEYLIKFGDDLINQSNNFDVEKISESIANFKEMIKLIDKNLS